MRQNKLGTYQFLTELARNEARRSAHATRKFNGGEILINAIPRTEEANAWLAGNYDYYSLMHPGELCSDLIRLEDACIYQNMYDVLEDEDKRPREEGFQLYDSVTSASDEEALHSDANATAMKTVSISVKTLGVAEKRRLVIDRIAMTSGYWLGSASIMLDRGLGTENRVVITKEAENELRPFCHISIGVHGSDALSNQFCIQNTMNVVENYLGRCKTLA